MSSVWGCGMQVASVLDEVRGIMVGQGATVQTPNHWSRAMSLKPLLQHLKLLVVLVTFKF